MKPFYLLALPCFLCPSLARADTPAEVKATIAFVQKLQTSTGAFISMPPQPNIRLAPNLRATNSAIHALRYLGGEIPDKEACIKYVANCFDPQTGGFANMPRNDPEVFTTAAGLMAVTTLKMPADRYVAGAVKFLAGNAKSFEDIRMAAAALERLNKPAPVATWLDDVRKLQNDDGSFGKGAGLARLTGGAAVTVLRLGGQLKGRDRLVQILNQGQRADGGWGNEEEPTKSDLETTYRVMRAYVLLKERPANEKALRAFIAKCRNDDGGYGMMPGDTSLVSATYFAVIVKHWLDAK